MKNKEIFTQISGGKYKGKKLRLPSLDTTRSTKSILKESFFNTLQFDICDSVFVEVFGGSGSMGLEALSRGAKKAYFVEKDKTAYRTLVENCKSVDENNSTCRLGDTFDITPQIIKEINRPFYLYLDPPFDFRDEMGGIYERCFGLVEQVSSLHVELVIFEHLSTKTMPQTIGEFTLQKTKKFGKSSLSYYAK